MDEEKQSHIINDYLDDDTDPAIRRLRPSVHSRAMVPALREQFVSVEAEPKQGEIQQNFVQGALQKPQSLHTQRPDKSVLFAACVLTIILFLGLVSFVFFKVF